MHDTSPQQAEAVRMSAIMHARFGHALNRLHRLIQADEGAEPIVEGETSADELVLQLEMVVDQLAEVTARYARRGQS